METYIVDFEENGSEYEGTLVVECNSLKVVSARTFEVNGARITIDEDIIEVKSGEGDSIWNKYQQAL